MTERTAQLLKEYDEKTVQYTSLVVANQIHFQKMMHLLANHDLEEYNKLEEETTKIDSEMKALGEEVTVILNKLRVSIQLDSIFGIGE